MKLDLNRGLEAVSFPRTPEAKQPPSRSGPIEAKPPPRSGPFESKPPVGNSPLESKSTPRNGPLEATQPLYVGEARNDPKASSALIKEYDFCDDENRTVALGPPSYCPPGTKGGPLSFMAPAATASPLPHGCYLPPVVNKSSMKPAEQERDHVSPPSSFLPPPTASVRSSGGSGGFGGVGSDSGGGNGGGNGGGSVGGAESSGGRSGEVSGGAQAWFPAYGSALREALERCQPADQPKVILCTMYLQRVQFSYTYKVLLTDEGFSNGSITKRC
jgi:hypothetical protein